ncbi:MAG: hypothetical protein M1827_006600 [Pycnora praestabilis]|nr:MAG: hypothetical protein M1827_006600 [Pycnora praestabilis]
MVRAGSYSFNPLHLVKRGQHRPYSTLPTYADNQTEDLSPQFEKDSYYRHNSSDSDSGSSSPSTWSNSSSRTTSDTRQPMLYNDLPSRSRSLYHYRIPTRTTRYLCLALFSTIVIFILSLIGLSWSSSRRLELGPLDGRPQMHAPWEEFPFLKRYYGGIRTLVPRAQNVPEFPPASDDEETPLDSSVTPTRRDERANDTVAPVALPPSNVFNPYPDYSSSAYLSEYASPEECFLDDRSTVRIPMVRSYTGVPEGFPNAIMGSYKPLGLRDDICFERYGRLGPYGYGYSISRGGTGAGLNGHREGADDVWLKEGEVDYRGVQWADVQKRCSMANKHRFETNERSREERFHSMDAEGLEGGWGVVQVRDAPPAEFAPPNTSSSASLDGEKKLLPRTAVVIRTWMDYEYSEEDILFLRAMISELSLLSGGEYTIHFLIHVKDDNSQIWADDEVYQRVVNKALPVEFRALGTLWTERQMGLIYGGLHESFYRGLPVHGAYRSSFMPMQYFAHRHPEFDYFWQWEMDVRYTGQFYDLFNSVSTWARNQPRKGLWERSGRFYIPSVHGSWEDFKQMVRVQTEMATESANNIWSGANTGRPKFPGDTSGKVDKPIWGPEVAEADNLTLTNARDPTPPTSYERDKYQWGVGEEADLITFNPMFDPEGTSWLLADDVTGYNTTMGLPPRRTAIITTSRLSRRLLETMHRETALERHTMFSEMWPASVALQHGLKAVYAPHPVYVDRKWPTSYFASVFNGGRNGASGGARTSVFGEREHNFRGLTWYYNAGFAPNLWNRWLGSRVDNGGGEEAELAGEGRMCLPGVMIHPVKGSRLIIEGGVTDAID